LRIGQHQLRPTVAIQDAPACLQAVIIVRNAQIDATRNVLPNGTRESRRAAPALSYDLLLSEAADPASGVPPTRVWASPARGGPRPRSAAHARKKYRQRIVKERPADPSINSLRHGLPTLAQLAGVCLSAGPPTFWHKGNVVGPQRPATRIPPGLPVPLAASATRYRPDAGPWRAGPVEARG